MVLRCTAAILCLAAAAAGVPALAGERPDFHRAWHGGQIFRHDRGPGLRYIPRLGQLGRSVAAANPAINIQVIQPAPAGAADTYVYGTGSGVLVIGAEGAAARDTGRPLAKVIQVEYGQNACSYEESVCVIRP